MALGTSSLLFYIPFLQSFTMKSYKNMLKGCVCAFFLIVILPLKAQNNRTIEQIKYNYKQLMMPPSVEDNDSLWMDLIAIDPETEVSDQIVEEVMRLFPFKKELVESYLTRLDSEGKWTDINYKDTKRSGWDPKKHAKRILELAKLLYSSDASIYGENRIKQAIHRALNYWFNADLKCLNWWYNQIGIPKTLGEALMLLDGQLTPEEKAGGIKVLKNSTFKMTGQNKVWLAGNVLMRGLMENNIELVKAARDTIASEIVLGRKEGIKSDWSFHQHGPQQQFGNYGMAFITGMCFYHRLFDGTELEFSKEQKKILSSFIDKGFQWVIWKRYMDVNALGRQLYKNVQLHKGYYLAMNAQGIASSLYPANVNTLIGHKHFYESDYSIHRSKNWMASLKMASNRVIGTELINEDNLNGFFMGDGATYFYVNGNEYANVFPFWDWRKIPGITAHEDTKKIPRISGKRSRNRTDKVGGISYQNKGLSAMELNRMGLKAYKAWLFDDDFVLCLGSGIQSDSSLCVTTSIDQRIKHGTLLAKEGRKWNPINSEKTYHGSNLRFFHDHTGYIVLDHATCIAKSEHREGKWHDFMGMYRPETVEGDVISLHINHGKNPKNAGYAYIVLPASNMKRTGSFKISGIQIIRNDETAQVVHLKKDNNIYWAVVYKPTLLKLGRTVMSIDKPGIYCLKVIKNETEIIEKTIF